MTKEEKHRIEEHLKDIVQRLPNLPGSYQFYDDTDTIIYVGKAKDLKKRVSSYFRKEVDRFKTQVLVSKIRNITYTVVKTEEDALLLENNLIKQYSPKYNILLKDGKTYPSICVTNETFPRIFKTRNIIKGHGTYFGPFSNVVAMKAMLDLIQKLYQPRRCKFPMSLEGVSKGKYNTCLEYHLHNCKAPCIGRQSVEDYRANIEHAKEILKGNTRNLIQEIQAKMTDYAAELNFEEAEKCKQQLLLINNYCAKSEVVSHTISNVDVFTISEESTENRVYINYMHVQNGVINQSVTMEYKIKLADESKEDLLVTAIIEVRERYNSTAKEVIVPFKLPWSTDAFSFIVPQRGDKKHLLELSLMNANQYKFDRLKQREKLNPEQKSVRLMKELQQKLGMEKMPFHIECFDNSNISGTNAVAGCVVFKGLKPSKSDYRKYDIKTVSGPDDYASMSEVVYRRYKRMVDESQPLPDLIITDGGKGQMEVVRRTLEEDLKIHIPIAGLAKDNRHRTNELLYGNPPVVIGLKPQSELFHALTRIQDEVHRYAIGFHRDKRSKQSLHSELDDITGVGPQTKKQLIKAFKSIKNIRQADIDSLANTIGPAKAKIVFEHFHHS